MDTANLELMKNLLSSFRDRMLRVMNVDEEEQLQTEMPPSDYALPGDVVSGLDQLFSAVGSRLPPVEESLRESSVFLAQGSEPPSSHATTPTESQLGTIGGSPLSDEQEEEEDEEGLPVVVVGPPTEDRGAFMKNSSLLACTSRRSGAKAFVFKRPTLRDIRGMAQKDSSKAEVIVFAKEWNNKRGSRRYEQPRIGLSSEPDDSGSDGYSDGDEPDPSSSSSVEEYKPHYSRKNQRHTRSTTKRSKHAANPTRPRCSSPPLPPPPPPLPPSFEETNIVSISSSDDSYMSPDQTDTVLVPFVGRNATVSLENGQECVSEDASFMTALEDTPNRSVNSELFTSAIEEPALANSVFSEARASWSTSKQVPSSRNGSTSSSSSGIFTVLADLKNGVKPKKTRDKKQTPLSSPSSSSSLRNRQSKTRFFVTAKCRRKKKRISSKFVYSPPNSLSPSPTQPLPPTELDQSTTGQNAASTPPPPSPPKKAPSPPSTPASITNLSSKPMQSPEETNSTTVRLSSPTHSEESRPNSPSYHLRKPPSSLPAQVADSHLPSSRYRRKVPTSAKYVYSPPSSPPPHTPPTPPSSPPPPSRPPPPITKPSLMVKELSIEVRRIAKEVLEVPLSKSKHSAAFAQPDSHDSSLEQDSAELGQESGQGGMELGQDAVESGHVGLELGQDDLELGPDVMDFDPVKMGDDCLERSGGKDGRQSEETSPAKLSVSIAQSPVQVSSSCEMEITPPITPSKPALRITPRNLSLSLSRGSPGKQGPMIQLEKTPLKTNKTENGSREEGGREGGGKNGAIDPSPDSLQGASISPEPATSAGSREATETHHRVKAIDADTELDALTEREGGGSKVKRGKELEKSTLRGGTTKQLASVSLSPTMAATVSQPTKSSRQKEKASEAPLQQQQQQLPEVIPCTACGAGIHWKKQQIHKHNRLDVLVCQECWQKFNTGNFVVEDGNEIYCTLCGEGGSLLCCDDCDKSFCESCVDRISGKEATLAAGDEHWMCYVCDATPLARPNILCENLCAYYQKRHKQLNGQKKLFSLKKSRVRGEQFEPCEKCLSLFCLCNNDEKNDGKNTRQGSSKGGGGGGGEKEDRGYRRKKMQKSSGDRASEKNRQDGIREGGKGGGDKDGRCQDGDQGSSGGGSGGRGNQQGGRKKRGEGAGGSSGESDSSDECDSPEVNTDDVSSLSDSILCHAHDQKKKKKLLRSELKSTRSSASEVDKQASSGRNPLKRKKLSIKAFVISSDSDFESEPPPPPPPSSQKTKKRALSVSSDASSVNLKPEKKPSKRAKISRLACTLSSSDEETRGRRKKLELKLAGKDNTLAEDDDESPAMFDSPVGNSQALVYRTTRGRLVSSSDSEGEMELMSSKKKPVNISSSGSDEPVKKTKPRKKYVTRSRKRKNDSNDDDFEDVDLSRVRTKSKAKKRRNVNNSFLSSEEDDSESDRKSSDLDLQTTPDTPGKKRKKIRKLILDSKLTAETKQAQRIEYERIKRLKKKAKLEKPATDSLVLEVDKEGQTVVEVRQSLLKHLKPHQKEGVKFLYDACVEKLEQCAKGQMMGAILAHCMGLGKTLQVIAFMDALLSHPDSGVKRVAVLSPINAIYNWKKEFEMWIPYFECDYNVFLLVEPGVQQRQRKLRRWFSDGGVLLIGYEMFRNMALGKRLKKARREEFQKLLLDPGADIVVCDEGHVMRNSKSSLSTILSQVKTLGRIVLTGTPLQNNLLEYYTMVSFVKPNLLGSSKEFRNRFDNPITNGQCRDSTAFDVRVMKQRAHVLHTLLDGTVQRRDYRVLAECLPPKQEYVVSIRMSPLQDCLYRKFLDEGRTRELADLFSTFSSLLKVWNHPWVLKLHKEREQERQDRLALMEETDEDDSLDGFIVYGSDEERPSKTRNKKKTRSKGKSKKGGASSAKKVPSSSSAISSSRSSSVSTTTGSTSWLATPVCITISSGDDDSDDSDSTARDPEYLLKHVKTEGDGSEATQAVCNGVPSSSSSNLVNGATLTSGAGLAPPPSKQEATPPPPWFDDVLTEDTVNALELSGKFLFLVQLLEEAEKLREKVLVFSQSLLTLNLIEEFLSKEEYGGWTPGLDYFRMDGSTKSDIRSSNVTEFNRVKNNRIRLFLISTRAGSLGVNLVGANRVVIFDACWNPSHDLQAVFRAYRYGQTKPIFVYRLLAQGTMEEKIYDRQVTKQSLSLRVVDEKQIGRHYRAQDLAELFLYSPAPSPETHPPDPVKLPEADMVLCSILRLMHPQWVVSYHEHDSLLEHVFDEELSEAERKAAWDSYNEAKKIETARYNVEATLQSQSTVASLAENIACTQSLNPMEKYQCAAMFRHLEIAIKTVAEGKELSARKNFLVQRHPQRQAEILTLELHVKKQYQLIGQSILTLNQEYEKLDRERIGSLARNRIDSLKQKLVQELQLLQPLSTMSQPPRAFLTGHPLQGGVPLKPAMAPTAPPPPPPRPPQMSRGMSGAGHHHPARQ